MAISFKAKKSKFYTKNLSTSTALKWCSVEKTFKSPLDRKEIKPIYPKANQPWIFIGRTDVKAPMLWPPDAKNWFIGKKKKKTLKNKDWRQEKKGRTEDEMVGWHHQQLTDSLEKILKKDWKKKTWKNKRLKAGEGEWGWDGWMASPTRWTWARSRSRSW